MSFSNSTFGRSVTICSDGDFRSVSTLEFVAELNLFADEFIFPDEGFWDCLDNHEQDLEVALPELPRLDSVSASGVFIAAELAGSILQLCSAEGPQAADAVLPSNKKHPETAGQPLVPVSPAPTKPAPTSKANLPANKRALSQVVRNKRPRSGAPGSCAEGCGSPKKRKFSPFPPNKVKSIRLAVDDCFQVGGRLPLEDINHRMLPCGRHLEIVGSSPNRR